MSDRQSSEYLSTLKKGLRVLKSFSRDRSKMTLSEVARVTKLNPAVARRCLITLLEMGYVGKVDNTFFSPAAGTGTVNAFCQKASI